MELSANIFLHHQDKKAQQKLESLINNWATTEICKQENFNDLLLEEAKNITPDLAEGAVKRFFSALEESYSELRDLRSERTGHIADYYYFNYTHGSNGIEIIEAILQFLLDLVPDLDARAYLCGDDDPWERFYRSDSGIVRSTDYEPSFEEAEENEDELPDEYEWWHENLPTEIKAGFIHLWKQL